MLAQLQESLANWLELAADQELLEEAGHPKDPPAG